MLYKWKKKYNQTDSTESNMDLHSRKIISIYALGKSQ